MIIVLADEGAYDSYKQISCVVAFQQSQFASQLSVKQQCEGTKF